MRTAGRTSLRLTGGPPGGRRRPGAPRSSHGTSSGSSARRPSSGTEPQSSRATTMRMAPVAVVARCDEGGEVVAPGREDALDRRRREVGPVGEDDDRGLRAGGERGEPAAQRRARAELPVGARDDPRAGRLQRVGARDDDDVVDGRLAEALQHARQKQVLLRRPEPGRRARREHDGPYVSPRGHAPGSDPRSWRCAAVRPVDGRRPRVPLQCSWSCPRQTRPGPGTGPWL